MKRYAIILSTVLACGIAGPSFAASLSMQDIKIRLASRIMLDIQFKVGSARVTKKGGKQIVALCDAMRAMPNMPSLHLIGHTDRSGRAVKNLEVSQNRAAAVKDYIVTECGLPGGLILTSGEGEAFAPRTGPANNADDRRIEVQLIGGPVYQPAQAIAEPVKVASAEPVKAAPAKPSKLLTTARGSFVGTTKFRVKGTTEIFRENGKWFVRLGPDFSESGAPDPKVALGNKAEGGYQDGTILGLVEANGESVYALKPGLDIGDYDQVWIWCERFNVPVGHADLTLL